MSRRLGALIATVALTSLGLLGAAILRGSVGENLEIKGAPDGIWLGLLFWIALTAIGASMAVRMPDGTVVDVGFAPIVAAMSLGGPIVAGVVALIGSTQAREIRKQVPWYGVLANHAGITGPAVLASILLSLAPLRSIPWVDFLATAAAACVFFILNLLVAAAFTSVRTGQPLWKLVRADSGPYLNMLALAPIAWLMAQMYVKAGWWAVLLFALPLYTTRIAYQRFVEVREMFTETVRSLAEAVDKRDTFTSGHSQRVQKIAMDIGKVMKVSDDELEALEWGGLLHDIGKIGVPDSVLLKQERLTRDERAKMNLHPVLGAEIISPVHRLEPELPIIRHHHEWFNGSGYPDRLVADEIPKLARILHVADAFEAMTAARPYRMTPLTPQQALAELRKFGGIQFDPDVVDAFVRTQWVRDVPDPGRPDTRDVPLIGHVAGQLAQAVAVPASQDGGASPGSKSHPATA
jgi:HD superfamily phosphohydrolase YqeK